MRKLILIGHFLVFFNAANGQSFFAVRNERSLVLLGGTGTSTYFGELSNPGDYIDSKPNLDVGLQYYFSNRISLRAEATWFQLQGEDAKADNKWRVQRNLSFRSNNIEASVTGTVNFFASGRRFYQRPNFNIYGFGGVGILYFNPTTEYQGERYALQPLRTELVDYKRMTPVVPLGFGIKLKINPLFNVSVEGGYRKTFTDYLDDVSTVHYSASSFSNPIAAALSDRRSEIGIEPASDGKKRGNPDADDGYFLLNAKLEFYLPTDFIFGNSSGARKIYTKKRKAVKQYNKRGTPKRR